jgi:hypothetical protein
MAYTTGASAATTAAAIQAATGNSVTAPALDACLNMLNGLATAQAPYPAIGSPILFANVLVKCTTGWGTPLALTTPVYAYDATAIT